MNKTTLRFHVFIDLPDTITETEMYEYVKNALVSYGTEIGQSKYFDMDKLNIDVRLASKRISKT